MTTNALEMYILPELRKFKCEAYITTTRGSFPVECPDTTFELIAAERLLIVTNDNGTHFINTDSITEINF